MPIDKSKLRARGERALAKLDQSSVFKWPEGETAFYVCPPLETMDSAPWVQYTQHSRFGPQNSFGVCLDLSNKEVWNEHTQAFLKQRKIAIDAKDGCPPCEALEVGDPAVKEMDTFEQFLFRIIPWERRISGQAVPYADFERVPRFAIVSPRIFRAIFKQLREDDITDPDHASLMVITRVGMGLNTKYPEIGPDTKTLRKPFNLPKPQRVALRKAMEPGCDLDPFKKLAWMIRPAHELEQLLQSGRVEQHDASDNVHAGKPACFGLEEEYDPDEKYCKSECKHFEECGEVVGVTAKEPEAEPEPPKRGRGRPRKPKPPSEPEPELEEEEEEVDDDPDYDEPEEEESDGESDEEEGETEPEPPPRRRRTTSRRTARGRVSRAKKEEPEEDDVPDFEPPEKGEADSEMPDDLAQIQAKLQRKRRARQ